MAPDLPGDYGRRPAAAKAHVARAAPAGNTPRVRATRPGGPTDAALAAAVRRVEAGWRTRHALLGAAVAALGVGAWLALRAGFAALGVASPAPPWAPPLVVAAGALLGALLGHRRRPPRAAIVAWIDARLGAGDALATVDDLGPTAPARAPRATARARAALAAAAPGALRPRLADRRLLAGPLGLLLGGAAWALTPAVPPRAPDPGAERVRGDARPLLRPIERLAAATPPDPADQARLARLERSAARLAEDLAAGMPRRAALDAAARLRRDLEALDASARRAAARREARDRAAARALLDAAARDARSRGDGATEARLLDLAGRLDDGDAATQAALAGALLAEVPELAALRGLSRRRLERLARDPARGRLDPATVDAVTKAWSRLTAAERARLADAFGDAEGFAERHDRPTAEGEGGAPDADAIEAALRQALAGADRLQLALATDGLPVPGAGGAGPGGGAGADGAGGDGAGGQAAGGQAAGGGGEGASRGGSGGAGGAGDGSAGEGATPDLSGASDGVLARVRPRRGDGAPGLTVIDRVDARDLPAPPTAAVGDAAGSVAGGGVGGGVERPELPRDYEAQVRAFFDGDR